MAGAAMIGTSRYCISALAIVIIVFQLLGLYRSLPSLHFEKEGALRTSLEDGSSDDRQASANTASLATVRSNYMSNCSLPLPSDWFQPTGKPELAKVEPCPLVFLDLGSNVGDSLGKVIDSMLPVDECPGSDSYRYNTDLGLFSKRKERPNNLLTKFTRTRMQEMGSSTRQSLLPSDYCFYGLEGNPLFTDRLQSLAARVMRSSPRPVRLAHFWTSTVAAGSNGPAILYLDTRNVEKNFWGSSILASHTDVQASAASSGNLVETPVEGKTLTTILQETVIGVPGSHVIIKMDVEGAEYAVLNEAFDSGILCNLTDAAVRVDILAELHQRVGLYAANHAMTHDMSNIFRSERSASQRKWRGFGDPYGMNWSVVVFESKRVSTPGDDE